MADNAEPGKEEEEGAAVVWRVPLADGCCDDKRLFMQVDQLKQLDFISRLEFTGMRLPLDPEWDMLVGPEHARLLLATDPSNKAIKAVREPNTACICVKSKLSLIATASAKRNPPTLVTIWGGIYHDLHRPTYAALEDEQRERALGPARCILDRELHKAFLRLYDDMNQNQAVEMMLELPLTKGCEWRIPALSRFDYIFHIEFKGMRQPLEPDWEFYALNDRILEQDPENPALRSGANNTGLLNITIGSVGVVFSKVAEENLPTSVIVGGGLLNAKWRCIFAYLEGNGQWCYPRSAHQRQD